MSKLIDSAELFRYDQRSKIRRAMIYATKEELVAVRESVTTVFHYKGAVSEVSDLPSSGNEAGDVYSVTGADAGNYVWTGAAWSKLDGIQSKAINKNNIDALFAV